MTMTAFTIVVAVIVIVTSHCLIVSRLLYKPKLLIPYKNKKHLREVSRRWTAKVQKKVNGWIKNSRFHLTTDYTDYYGFGFDNFKVAGSQWVRIGLAGIRFERYPIVFRYIFVIYSIIYRTTIGELSNN